MVADHCSTPCRYAGLPIRIVVGVLLGWLLLPVASISGLTAQQTPNILLIVSEDNGPELGCYGAPHVATPVLDRLAAEGVLFRRAFVPQAGYSQSRAAFPFDMHEIPGSNFARKDQARYAQIAERFLSAGDKPFFLSVNFPDAHRPFRVQVDGLPAQPLVS